ncbi:MAG TPA: trypsin-like peptidase domain-containing protein, partial [Mycobacteriales bacterium]|nr:trypsin-like peptidase domain-containing protein [Mycobacteriales bacterium]
MPSVRMPRARRRAQAAICVAATVAGLAAASTPASARSWARPAAAIVAPSMMLYTKGAQCTANFVYVDRAGRVYIGQAAHCSSRGGQTDTNGCTTRSWPLGTVVRNENGRRIGTLAYNSWIAMRRAHEKRANVCAANDLALVRVDRSLLRRTSPTVPGLGGPVGLNTRGVARGTQVYAVGNSSLLFGAGSLVAQTGVVEKAVYGGWAWFVAMARPGVPGDSGSGYLDSRGRALGQLSTIAVGTDGAGNTIGNLSKEITYARYHGVRGLSVAHGTTRFHGMSGLITQR